MVPDTIFVPIIQVFHLQTIISGGVGSGQIWENQTGQPEGQENFFQHPQPPPEPELPPVEPSRRGRLWLSIPLPMGSGINCMMGSLSCSRSFCSTRLRCEWMRSRCAQSTRVKSVVMQAARKKNCSMEAAYGKESKPLEGAAQR